MTWPKKLTKTHLILFATLAVAVVLFTPRIGLAYSGIDTILIQISSWIITQIIYVVGQLLLIAISILIKVASFNEFVDANVVKIGWVIMRDIANMAIVIALMIIAFYTVLNKQSYHFKTMLPKLVIAAILVNFSKSIAGLLIDFGQVIMMTFVHAFQDIAAGNLTYGFGLEDMMSIRNAAEGAKAAEINDWTVFGALALGALMVVVALGVVVSMIVMLLARIVRLWLLIIFSPIAYVAGLIPGMEKHSRQWWDDFNKQIIFGPTLAFLFWLSMKVLSELTADAHLMNLEMQAQQYLSSPGVGARSGVDYAYFASQVSSPQRIFDYMVTVALLIFCLIVAKQAGVAGSEVAGNFMNKLQGAGKWVQKKGQRLAIGTAKTPFKAAGAGIGAGLRRISTTAPLGLGAIGALARDRYARRQREKQRAWGRRLEKAGAGELTGDWLAQHVPNRFPLRNLRTAAMRISADTRAARAMAGQYNDTATPVAGGPTGGHGAWATTTPGGVYSTSEGIRGAFRRALPQFTMDAVTNFHAAVVAGNVDRDLTLALQRAFASFRHGGGNITPVLAAFEGELDIAAGRHGLPTTGTITQDQVVYSKTNLNDLMRYNQIKQSFEEFKLKPENKDVNEEELERRFFRSEMALQAYRQGNNDTRELVNEAASQGMSEFQLRELGVQNLNVRAGKVQFEELIEAPSAEQMQVEYQRIEDEMRRIVEATHQGITVGQYGRREGANTLAVGFDELNEYMKKRNLGHVTGLEDRTSEGVRVQNVEQVRQGLAGILEDQINKLREANTNKEKVEALKLFGVQTDEENPNLNSLIQRAEIKGRSALTKLQNKELIDQEGLVLINKNRISGVAKEVIRHEEVHNMIRRNDQNGEIRKEITDSLTSELKQKINQHLQGRSDFNKLNDEQKVEEYAADVMAGRARDDKFREILLGSDLLSKTVPEVKTVVINLKDVEVKPEVKQAIEKTPEIKAVVNKVQGQVNRPGFFSNDWQYKLLRKSIGELNEQTSKMGKNLKIDFGEIGKQINNLDMVLPKTEATPLEVKAVTQEHNISEEDLREFLNNFSK